MNYNDASHSRQPSRRSSHGEHDRREQRDRRNAYAEREQRSRRVKRGQDDQRGQRERQRAKQKLRRSVGATSISAPGANALGLSQRTNRRPYGRGETARRVEESRRERQEAMGARPAVYTAEPAKRGILSRIHAPALSMPSFSAATIPTWLFVLVGLALAFAVIIGPARNYYLAWREAGVLQVRYEVVAAQNEELNSEIDRLQTEQGIEDEARARGYVLPGEEALVVEGVEEGIVADPAQVEKAVEQYEQSLPWYVGVLDSLFGYQRA